MQLTVVNIHHCCPQYGILLLYYDVKVLLEIIQHQVLLFCKDCGSLFLSTIDTQQSFSGSHLLLDVNYHESGVQVAITTFVLL